MLGWVIGLEPIMMSPPSQLELGPHNQSLLIPRAKKYNIWKSLYLATNHLVESYCGDLYRVICLSHAHA